jgi:predicted aspartyl protease
MMGHVDRPALVAESAEAIVGCEGMGKVLVAVKVENLSDVYLIRRGALAPDQLRSIDVADALVDTGATNLSMPGKLIQQLGLKPVRERKARTSAGVVTLQVYEAVNLTVQGREAVCEVTEIPDDCPVLIGQVPLEILDFVVDPQGQRLIGNPAHGGEQMIELY